MRNYGEKKGKTHALLDFYLITHWKVAEPGRKKDRKCTGKKKRRDEKRARRREATKMEGKPVLRGTASGKFSPLVPLSLSIKRILKGEYS